MTTAMLQFAVVVRYIAKRKTKTMSDTTQKYTELISEIKDTVFRLASSLMGDSDEAKDVTQDAYERVWRARDTVLAQRYPRAYVCRMVRNLAIDRLRSKRRLCSLEEGWKSAAIDNDRAPNHEISDIAELTRRCIMQLPERQRIAIHMRDVEGYEIEEIAETLECDPTSVRMNLSRARKSVREEIIKSINHGTR